MKHLGISKKDRKYIKSISKNAEVFAELTHERVAARIAALEAQNAELIAALREIANDWPFETPDIPAAHARKIARAAIASVKG